MRQLKNVSPKLIALSDVESLRQAGYVPLNSGDASKANSDYFMIFVKPASEGGRELRIVCPTFLLGTLGLTTKGAISY